MFYEASDNDHKHGSFSEVRQDLVSGDWVVIATGRAKRPHDFLQEGKKAFRQPKRTCPFENLHENALLSLSLGAERGKNIKPWVKVVVNKFPAFQRGVCSIFHKTGPYQWTDGVGQHEVVITRDHERSLGQMADLEAELAVRAYQERYRAIKQDECVRYISIFHNHGRGSGATLSHPHSQIIGIPVIPSDIARSIRGSAVYYEEHKECVHCVMLKFEKNDKKRLIYENDHFLVFAPFASRLAFEIRIYPKNHVSHFEDASEAEIVSVANALRVSLGKIFKGLNNPDYNFFLHTSPIDKLNSFRHYHWHFEILPKTSIWAGFEIGTGIEISTITPENAAEFLRNIKV
ncbi:MAG: DUF4921 family protein [Candidatus Sungbacteria bacterium]|nr:DUF4921 family protein [Candidatus Sungbacteria bacterium]